MRLPLILSLLITAFPAYAQPSLQNFRPSPAEMRQLPDYCAVKFNSTMDAPDWKLWREQLGPNYIDMHHYCAGLNFLNRYYVAQSKADKSGMLVAAKRNFDYMMRAAKPDFSLRADIYLHRGRTLKLMGQQGTAISDFQQALTINPKLTKAYLELMSSYVANNQKQKALETAIAGLKQLPNTTSLQRRYRELGGKLPYPQPDPVVPTNETAKPDPAVGLSPTTPDAGSDPAQANIPQPTETTGSETGPKPAEATPPALGSPTNPYCRFCP